MCKELERDKKDIIINLPSSPRLYHLFFALLLPSRSTATGSDALEADKLQVFFKVLNVIFAN